VQAPYYPSETMSNGREAGLQHRMNRWGHRSNAPVQWRQRCRKLRRKKFRTGWTGAPPVQCTGLTGGFWSTVPEGQRIVESREWPVTPVLHHRSNRCSAQKWSNGYKRLYGLGGLYICHPSAILEFLEFRNITPTPKNISNPSKSLVIISLVLSTYLIVLVLD